MRVPDQKDIQPTISPEPQRIGFTQTDLQHHSQELGWMGKIFGSRANSPGNIAGVCVVISILALCFLLVYAPEGPRTSQGITLFGGIVTLALGYLFGRSGGSKDDD
jgi:hypothetical protein